jgi:hypothetical protein
VPDDDMMLLLAGVWAGGDLEPRGAELVLRNPRRNAERTVDPAHLDALESRGWVVIGAEFAEVTAAGEYWLRKWFRGSVERRGWALCPRGYLRVPQRTGAT